MNDTSKEETMPGVKDPIARERRFVPPPVKGYRNLTDGEVALMNRVKSENQAFRDIFETVQKHISVQYDAMNDKRMAAHREMNPEVRDQLLKESYEEEHRLNRCEPGRWMSIARTHFQQAIMALTRAVAQPDDQF